MPEQKNHKRHNGKDHEAECDATDIGGPQMIGHGAGGIEAKMIANAPATVPMIARNQIP